MPRVILAVFVACILDIASARVAAQDYPPAECDGALPYAGQPTYSQRVTLPPAEALADAAFEPATRQRLEGALDDALRRRATTGPASARR
jgi:hypothetical protein